MPKCISDRIALEWLLAFSNKRSLVVRQYAIAPSLLTQSNKSLSSLLTADKRGLMQIVSQFICVYLRASAVPNP
jgi:hypothetical protein